MKSLGPFFESPFERSNREEATRAAANYAIAELCIKRQREGQKVKLAREHGYTYRIEPAEM